MVVANWNWNLKVHENVIILRGKLEISENFQPYK